jgi:short-subunit dehydrogenase
MEGTPLFQKTASARGVAKAGYNAMLRGKLNVVAGVPFARRIMYMLIPFLPKRMVLREVRKTQEVA